MSDAIAPFAYESLPHFSQLVAQCYGVVHPNGLARTSVVQLCARADIRHQGRRLTSDQAKAATNALIDAGVAYRNRQQLVILDTAWALPMTIAAQRQGTLEAIWHAYDPDQPRYGFFMESGRLEMLARYCAVTGRYRDLETISTIPASAWRFLAYDEDGALLDGLPERYREAALGACLAEVIDNLAPAEQIIRYCTRTPRDAAHFAQDVAFIRILQGRFADAERTFSDLPESAQGTKRVSVGFASTQALIATLQGNDEQATCHIDRACELERSGTRKRNVFPASRAFALAILSLVRVDTPQSMERLKQLLRAAERADVFPWFVQLVQTAQAARANTFSRDGLYSECPFQTMLLGITQCWRAESSAYHANAIHRGVLHAFDRATAGDYLWVAAEAGTALHHISTLLEQDGQPVGGKAAKVATRAAKAAIDLHGQCGTTSLATLVQPTAPWEQAIKDLELLAYEVRKKANAKPRQPTSTIAERLAWELCTDEYDEVRVTPKRQRAVKRGGWTKGQVVSIKRLATDSASVDCLIAQDQAVIGAIKRDSYRWRSHYLDARAVYQLVDHPHVINTNGDPVEVIRRDPELTISEVVDSAGNEALIARLEPASDENETYITTMIADNRCEVTRFNASHQRLRDIIPPEGLTLPKDARARLVDAVTALASEVRIQSSVAGSAGDADEIEGDPDPWAQLVPSGEGLTLSLVVEPAPESGQFFTPGQGGASVYAPTADGQVMAVRRDLKAECAQLEALLELCPVIPAGHDPAQPLTLSQPAACLELLEQLETHTCAVPGRVTNLSRSSHAPKPRSCV